MMVSSRLVRARMEDEVEGEVVPILAMASILDVAWA